MKKLSLLTWAVLCCWLTGCRSDEPNTGDRFDRKAMLTNFAQNLIKPAYDDLQQRNNALKTATDNFVQNPNAQSLTALRAAWETAYTTWQYANAYNFGPAGEQGLRKALIEEIGTFPVSVDKIESIIAAGNANFNDFNRDARGYLTVEYLIYGNDATVLAQFAAQNRRNFLANLAADIKRRTDEVAAAWNGAYMNEFINNAGTDVGSSTSLLYNEFVKSFEATKNFKVGLPLGKRPGQTRTEPQRVEAYYSGKSLEMLRANLTAVENIWYGKSKDGREGTGFRAYLTAVEGGNQLIASTESQWRTVKQSLNAVPTTPPMAVLIEQNAASLETLHTELQRHTRFFKSDMSSLLGIAITFSSGDGD